MIFWEYLLTADNRLDLADADRGYNWFSSQRWMPAGGRAWDQRDRAEWTQNVFALRSIAKRLKKARVTHPFPPMPHYDGIFDSFIGKLVPTIRRRGDAQRPLTSANYAGVTFQPTLENAGRRQFVTRQHWEPDVFWQNVFGSMIAAELAAICESCGSELPPSKQGRTSRRRRCTKCNWKAWRKRQTKSRMRKKWRTDRIKQSRQERNP